MSHRNATLISIPPDVAKEIVLKRFLSALVEKLDTIFGFRGEGSPFVTDAALEDGILTLQELIDAAEAAAKAAAEEAAATAKEEAIAYANANFTNNPIQSAIADLAYTAPTVSAGYVQSEVQGIADDLETTSDKLDTLLAALRTANILEV